MISSPHEFSDEQFSQLVGGGECHIHTHPKEQLDFSDRLELMLAEPFHEVSSNYTMTKGDELLMVDTTAGDVTITLPLAANGREFQVVKKVNANALFIVPTPTNNIIGSTDGVVVYNRFTSLHIKAIPGGYILI